MRKIYLLAFALLIFLLNFNTSFAALKADFAKDSYKTEISSGSAQNSNYELPYPGLLPNSPIYFLRAIRDKIVSFLISDPLKKAEFDLLQSDKRLNAGIYLFNSALLNEKKINLALSTISKAENYFEQAIERTKEAKRQGMEAAEVIHKLIDSSKKHEEVLKSLEQISPQNFKAGFDRELQRAVRSTEQAVSLTLN